jgi:hypothetical protein
LKAIPERTRPAKPLFDNRAFASQNPLHFLAGVLEKHFPLVASLVLNIVLVAGLFLAWSIISEMSRIRNDLSGFESFEARVSKRLEVFNEGLQSRLAASELEIQQMGNTIRDVQTAIDGIGSEVDGLQEALARSSNFTAPANIVPAQPEPVVIEAPNAAPPEPSNRNAPRVPQFKRVIQENGKVTYQRVN